MNELLIYRGDHHCSNKKFNEKFSMMYATNNEFLFDNDLV